MGAVPAGCRLTYSDPNQTMLLHLVLATELVNLLIELVNLLI